VTSLVAAFLEPVISVATFLVVALLHREPVDRSALTLCMLAFALTFPGQNHFRENVLAAGMDTFGSWIILLPTLALCATATRSWHYVTAESTRIIACTIRLVFFDFKRTEPRASGSGQAAVATLRNPKGNSQSTMIANVHSPTYNLMKAIS
jgi:hypothetical protein